MVNLTALLWDSSRIYTTELKEKQLVRLKGEAKLTKSEKTAPIDMLRTISSSSSVSDIVPDLLVDEFREREREKTGVLFLFYFDAFFFFLLDRTRPYRACSHSGPSPRKGPKNKTTKKLSCIIGRTKFSEEFFFFC